MSDENHSKASELTTKFLKRVQQEALPWIVNSTIPFYGVQDDQIKRDRSGVLLRLADSYFILTASHDLKEFVEHKIPLYVGWDKEEKVAVPLSDSVFHTTDKNSLDVAVIKLTNDDAEKILTTKQAISMRDISSEIDESPGMFLVCGFPQEWLSVSSEKIDSTPLPFFGRFFEGETSPTAQIKFDPKVHALFEFNQNAIRASNKESFQLPRFDGIKGISGCGVWRILDWEKDSIETWNPDNCKLVAIQHRYYEKQCYVHTTWIKYALSLIANDYPHLQSAMKIVYPK